MPLQNWRWVVVASIISFAADRGLAQTPIPNGPECYTRAKFYHDLQAVRVRRLRLYDEHTQDPAEVRAEAAKFMADFQQRWLEILGWRTWPELAATGRSLQERGSNDPLVELFIVRARDFAEPGTVRYESEFWSVFERLAKTNYPALWKVEPLWYLNRGWTKRVPKGLPSAKELIAAVADAWIHDPEAAESDRRYRWFWLEHFFETLEIDDKAIFVETCANFIDADPWLYNMLAGEYHIDLGWHHRGGGWGHTVSDVAAWQFQDNLRKAAIHLQIAWQVDPKLPEPAARSITTSMAGDQPTATARTWFDRAVAAQMDFGPAYDNYGWALRPRWGGSHEALYAFGKECLATGRFDTNVPRDFISALAGINADLDGHYAVFRSPEVWAEVQQAYQGLLAKGDRGYNLADSAELTSEWMLYALHSEHYDDACAAFKQIEDHGWKIHPQIATYFNLREASVRPAMMGVSGPGAAGARILMPHLLRLGRIDTAVRDQCLAAYDEVLRLDEREMVRDWFGTRRQFLVWEKAYDEGGWVDLKFSPKLTGWISQFGKWTYEDDGSVTAVLDTEQPPLWQRKEADLLCNARFPGPYEVRVEVSLPKGCKKPVAPGVCVMSDANVASENSAVRCCWISPLQGRGGMTEYYENHLGAQGPIELKGKNEIRVQVWPNLIVSSVNGYELPIEKKTPELQRERISLHTAFHLDPKVPVRYEHVRVRKLTRGPPPPEAKRAARIEYYTAVLAEEPDDPSALWKRGAAEMDSRQYVAAAKDLDRAVELQPGGVMIRLYRGLLAEKMGDFAVALAAYEACTKLDPGVLGSWRRLAWVQATCRETEYRNGTKALAAAKQACQITKMRDCDSLVALSAAHAELGEHAEAIAAAKKALALAPKEEKAWTTEFLLRREARTAETYVPAVAPATSEADGKEK